MNHRLESNHKIQFKKKVCIVKCLYVHIQPPEIGYITMEVFEKKGVLIKLILSIYHIGGIILNSGPQSCALGNETYRAESSVNSFRKKTNFPKI